MEFDNLYKQKDSLTGFHSREALSNYLHERIKATQSAGKVFSLLLLDIDHFKLINDRFGHQAGDEALKFFANTISDAIKGEHFVARYGGDEFIVVTNYGHLKDGLETAKAINTQLNKKYFIFKGKAILIKASIGVAVFPLDADDSASLIKKADEALYYAKKHGRSKIVFASKLKSFYSKIGYLSPIIKLAILIIIIVALLKIHPGKFIDFQGIYNHLIIKGNYEFHKATYKYNYGIIELDDQSRFEGWILREDKDRVFISKKIPDKNASIIEIPRKRIRIYSKALKK